MCRNKYDRTLIALDSNTLGYAETRPNLLQTTAKGQFTTQSA